MEKLVINASLNNNPKKEAANFGCLHIKMENIQIHKAWLWDGSSQLEGRLLLSEKKLIFKPKKFNEGNLKIEIPVSTILKMESFLLFGISNNGIKIITNDGKEDRFILENIPNFKKELLHKMKIAK